MRDCETTCANSRDDFRCNALPTYAVLGAPREPNVREGKDEELFVVVGRLGLLPSGMALFGCILHTMVSLVW